MVARWAVQLSAKPAGAYGGAPHIDLVEHGFDALEGVDLVFQAPREGLEFLAQGHGYGVLKLGASHLDDVVELPGFAPEGAGQTFEFADQFAVAKSQGDVKRGGIGVVGGLGGVDVIVRVAVLVLALLFSPEFDGAVGDHLVGVHVGGCAGAALEDIELELIVKAAPDQFAARGFNGLRDLRGELAALAVGAGGCHFDHSEGLDQLRIVRQRHSGDVEVFHPPQGLDSVVCAGGHFAGSQKVLLHAGFQGCGRHGFRASSQLPGDDEWAGCGALFFERARICRGQIEELAADER